RIAGALVGESGIEPALAFLELDRRSRGIVDREVHGSGGGVVAGERGALRGSSRGARIRGKRADAFLHELVVAGPRRKQQGVGVATRAERGSRRSIEVASPLPEARRFGEQSVLLGEHCGPFELVGSLERGELRAHVVVHREASLASGAASSALTGAVARAGFAARRPRAGRGREL